jgi:hypothetical protein
MSVTIVTSLNIGLKIPVRVKLGSLEGQVRLFRNIYECDLSPYHF